MILSNCRGKNVAGRKKDINIIFSNTANTAIVKIAMHMQGGGSNMMRRGQLELSIRKWERGRIKVILCLLLNVLPDFKLSSSWSHQCHLFFLNFRDEPKVEMSQQDIIRVIFGLLNEH